MKEQTNSSDLDLASHAYALDASGYTRVPAVVDRFELQLLSDSADRALERVQEVARRIKEKTNASSQDFSDQGELPYTFFNEYYMGNRCMYTWGDACLRLLENEPIHTLAKHMMGSYHLWDMNVMATLPAPQSAGGVTTNWHRDLGGQYRGLKMPAYLWCFLCLDDVTAENGATWVIPGSHHLTSPDEPPLISGDTAYPTGLQLCGNAGDLLVLNPELKHNSGHNRSGKPRRILNIALCNPALSPLLNHWAIVGPAIREQASPRLRTMLNADPKPLATTWPALPEGWQASQ